MNFNTFDKSSACSQFEAMLSAYMDNTLSARQVWEVEKHLAGCGGCSAMFREVQSTVQLLRAAPRFDTGDNFMALLHTRLDSMEPQPVQSRSLAEVLRDWVGDTRTALLRNRLPALGLGMASAALCVLVVTNHPVTSPHMNTGPAAVTENLHVSENVHVSVAASANSAFSDPAAVNLEDRSASPN